MGNEATARWNVESIAQMLGARRTTVTLLASRFQQDGLMGNLPDHRSLRRPIITRPCPVSPGAISLTFHLDHSVGANQSLAWYPIWYMDSDGR